MNKVENNLMTMDWADYKANWHVPIFSNKGKKQSEDQMKQLYLLKEGFCPKHQANKI